MLVLWTLLQQAVIKLTPGIKNDRRNAIDYPGQGLANELFKIAYPARAK